MSDPFLGEIKIVSFNFAPRGWALCNGQLLPINQNQALFSLLGTTYGGDGRVNFALPNFQGRVPVHVGGGIVQGMSAGTEQHTLTIAELPTHDHTLAASSVAASVAVPGAGALPAVASTPLYRPDSNPGSLLHPESITSVGGSQPHSNMQPILGLNFAIALQGIFPSQN